MVQKSFITGIGGIFFKCEDVEKTRAWYRDVLGIPIDDSYGGSEFEWREKDEPSHIARTVWAPFKKESDYFGNPDAQFMINYRVRDLDALLSHLKAQGIERIGEIEDHDYGRFAWVLDPDGRRIEFWEPKGEHNESAN